MTMHRPAEILLVEDDPNDVELTLRALRNANSSLCVEVARDGEEALDYLLRRGQWRDRSADHFPSFVLLDLKLPKIDGLQVLRQIKTATATAPIPIVVLTSSGEHRDIAESYRLGANSYVQKPVDITEFRSTIRAIADYWLNVSQPSHPLPKPRPERSGAWPA